VRAPLRDVRRRLYCCVRGLPRPAVARVLSGGCSHTSKPPRRPSISLTSTPVALRLRQPETATCPISVWFASHHSTSRCKRLAVSLPHRVRVFRRGLPQQDALSFLARLHARGRPPVLTIKVRRGGVEPPRGCPREILSLVRLPIPPPPPVDCVHLR
jgi:hypothetical protein